LYAVEAGDLHLFTCSLDLKEKSEGEMWISDKWKREGREEWSYGYHGTPQRGCSMPAPPYVGSPCWMTSSIRIREASTSSE
jgi:hypothetical protein